MMFHDSMAIAQEKMTKVCVFLERHALPPSPLNYNVVYTYVSDTNNDLTATLDQAIAHGQIIDCVYIEQLYFDHMDKAHKDETSMVRNIDTIINSLSHTTESTENEITQYVDHINDCMYSLDEYNIEKSRKALETLQAQTAQLLKKHQAYKQALATTKKRQENAQQQLVQLRKKHIIDQQTGLYKRHFLNQKTQLWLSQNKSVCAIAIQIENLDHFINNYGDIIGEIILNKVAKQIQKYVFQSGLPGRTGKGEFTILIADIDPDTASLIAEKVRNGVEKLRFVSSKSGIKLPIIDLSLGIAKRKEEKDFNKLARNASNAAHKAKSLGQSSYITGV